MLGELRSPKPPPQCWGFAPNPIASSSSLTSFLLFLTCWGFAPNPLLGASPPNHQHVVVVLSSIFILTDNEGGFTPLQSPHHLLIVGALFASLTKLLLFVGTYRSSSKHLLSSGLRPSLRRCFSSSLRPISSICPPKAVFSVKTRVLLRKTGPFTVKTGLYVRFAQPKRGFAPILVC